VVLQAGARAPDRCRDLPLRAATDTRLVGNDPSAAASPPQPPCKDVLLAWVDEAQALVFGGDQDRDDIRSEDRESDQRYGRWRTVVRTVSLNIVSDRALAIFPGAMLQAATTTIATSLSEVQRLAVR
jgi:hypothetical protein